MAYAPIAGLPSSPPQPATTNGNTTPNASRKQKRDRLNP
jgi:hypothetical protein